jgi:large subunit ribosomal protein L4
MYKAAYYKTDGKKGRARALPDWLFDGVVNEGVLHRVVKAHLANKRQGTAAAKNRAAVRGGSKKPWRQKGTGRARQGTIRAAQWEGGGMAFPPQPHSWNQKVPRKVKSLARRSAFNARAEEDRVILIDALKFEAPKTAQLRDYLATIEAPGKILLLTEGQKENVYLSARNLPDVEVRPLGEESTYDILWATTVIIERGALENAEVPAKEAAVGDEAAKTAEEVTDA